MDMKNYSVGFARLDITPPLGVKMIGAGPRVTKGVLDPLLVNAIAFGGEEKSAVILVCDLLGMYGSFGDKWPNEIAEKLGMDKNSVFIHCICTVLDFSLNVINSTVNSVECKIDGFWNL